MSIGKLVLSFDRKGRRSFQKCFWRRQFGKGLMPRQYRLKCVTSLSEWICCMTDSAFLENRATDFSPLLLPTLSRTFPSLPSPHAPTLQRHTTHRSSMSQSSFVSSKEEDLVCKEEYDGQNRGGQQGWSEAGGIRIVGG